MKTVVVALAILMLTLYSPSGLEASNGFSLAVSSAEGQPGEQVVITVSAENTAGAEGGQFLLLFDPEIVQPVSLETGEMITDASNSLYMSNLEYQDGELIFMWVTPEADTDDSGIVCDITFNLLRDGVTILDLDEVILVPAEVQLASMEPGKVAVGDAGFEQDDGHAGEIDDDPANDSEEDKNDVVDNQAAGTDDTAEEEAALRTGAARTGTLIYAVIFTVIVLALGLYFILKKKNRGKQNAGR